MRGLQAQRFFHVLQRRAHALTGQCVHQVEVEVSQPRCVQFRRGPPRLIGGMNATKRLQLPVVKALRAERDPRDARGPILVKAPSLDRPGVRLQGHFDIRRQTEEFVRGLQNVGDRSWGEEARRTATQEDADDFSAADIGCLRLEIGLERRDVGGLRELAVQRVRIEVAVGALPHAPREVNVEGEGWGRRGGHPGYGTPRVVSDWPRRRPSALRPTP